MDEIEEFLRICRAILRYNREVKALIQRGKVMCPDIINGTEYSQWQNLANAADRGINEWEVKALIDRYGAKRGEMMASPSPVGEPL